MELTIGGTQTYTLPLQSIDLTYLSKNIPKSRNEIIPLWSKRCLDGEDEYYEVQIMAQEINEDDCYCETSETYMCHICDLDVPKIYVKEHNESEIHEKFKNIFEKVLERLSKQLNCNIISTDRDTVKDEYYCEPCSKVVKLKNKYKHESSSFHRKTVENCKTLNDFYKIFNRIEGREEIDETIAPENNFTDEKQLKSNHKADNNINHGSTQNSKKNHTKHQYNEVDSDDDFLSIKSGSDQKMETRLGSKSPNITSDDDRTHQTTNFQAYLKEMVVKYKLPITNIPSTDGDYIHVVSSNGDKLKISRANFHSYKEINNSTYCQICKLWISTNTKAHDVMESHVRSIFKPVNNDFCRTINNVMKHCLLCNEIFYSQFDHAQSESHKTTLKNSKPDTIITKPANPNDTAKTGKTLCNYCNVSIDTHNFVGHTNSRKHQNKKQLILAQNKITKEDNGNYFCNYCNISLTEIALYIHINQNSHINKKSEKSDVPTNCEYCELCDVYVPKGGMDVHNREKAHIILAITKICSDLCSNKDSEVNNENSTRSTPEDIGNASSSDNSSQISYTTNDNSEENKLAEYSKLLVYTDSTKTKVKCKICNVPVPNNERNVFEHMEGRNHMDIVNSEKMGDYAKFLEYTDDKRTKVKCKVCDLNVPLVERNIFEHMNGRNHEVWQRSLLQYNTISERGAGYFCTCCDSYFEHTNYLVHINSNLHTENYQNKYVIDKKLIRLYVYDDDTNNSIALRCRVLYKNLLRVNEIIKLDDTKFFCNICAIDLCRINEIDHMLGDRHKLRRQELLGSILTPNNQIKK